MANPLGQIAESKPIYFGRNPVLFEFNHSEKAGKLMSDVPNARFGNCESLWILYADHRGSPTDTSALTTLSRIFSWLARGTLIYHTHIGESSFFAAKVVEAIVRGPISAL